MFNAKKPKSAAGNPTSPKPTQQASNSAPTFIGTGVYVEGAISTSAPLRIDGRVKGEINGKEELTIGESGLVEGPIEATSVVIAGEVKGNVTVTGELRVLPTGRLIGDAFTPNLIIEEGAHFKGRCEMTQSSQGSQSAGAALLNMQESRPANNPKHGESTDAAKTVAAKEQQKQTTIA